MYISFHVKYPLFLSNFNEILIFWTYFRKILKYQIHENPSNGIRVVQGGRIDAQAGMTELIVDFRRFAKALK